MVKTRARTTFGLLLALGSTALGGGCQLIAGIRDAEPATPDGGLGGGGSGGGASTCANGIKDGKETGNDCGGPCSPCLDGEGCDVGPDCASKVCTGGSCLAAACDDKVKNGDETDADCGGSCPKCGAEKGCKGGADCKSGQCAGGVCASTCVDTVKGGAETDVDCGGGLASGCGGCADGRACKANADCTSGICNVDACAPYYLWDKQFGNSGFQQVFNVASDGSGSSAIAGQFAGTIDFGGGPLTAVGTGDIYVTKVDSTGAHLWSRRFGEAQTLKRATSVAMDAAGSVFITGSFGGNLVIGNPLTATAFDDIFVAKLDSTGLPSWARSYGSPSKDIGNAISVDGGGNIVVAGVLNDDVFVAKLDPSGTKLWGKSFGDPMIQRGRAVAADKSGNIIVTGTFRGSIDFGGGPLTNGSVEDIFIVKLNPLGDHIWSKSFSIPTTSTNNVATDSAGNVIFTGAFSGTVDFGGGPLTSANSDMFIVKYDPSGAILWSKQFAGTDGTSVSVDANDNILIAGPLFTTIDFGGGPLKGSPSGSSFVLKMSPMGQHIWSKKTASGVSGLAAAGATSLVLTGSFAGTVDLGGGPLTSVTGNDIFLAKLRTP